MKSAIMRNMAVAVILVGSAWSVTAAAEGERYSDPIYGFSLIPPAGGRITHGQGTTPLVSWSRSDLATNKPIWSLGVYHAVEANSGIQLEPYAKALAGKLWAEEQFKAESIDLSPVAGKPAIDMVGKALGTGMWQRQVWILAYPPELIALKMTGPAEQAKNLAARFDQVLSTLRLSDPTKARRTRAENLERGGKFLASVREADLTRAARFRPRWYLLTKNGRYVGFRRVTAGPASRQGADGIEVCILQQLRVPEVGKQLFEHKMFVTGDMKIEWCRKRLRMGEPPKARTIVTETLKQNEMLVASVTHDGRSEPRQIEVPAQGYLPQAVGQLLGRLIDLKSPAPLAFLAYSPERNSFTLRTLCVIGPDQIRLPGRSATAVKVTDQRARDVRPNTLWLGSDGGLLRLETGDGLVAEYSTGRAVQALFPEAARYASKSGK